jgi:hypothetical protein
MATETPRRRWNRRRKNRPLLPQKEPRMSEEVTSPSEAARIPLAAAERFRVSVHYGGEMGCQALHGWCCRQEVFHCADAVVSVQVDKVMNVARACAVIVKKTACKTPENHVLVATWYTVPSVIQARTLQPTELLGAAIEALPSCDGVIELYFHGRRSHFDEVS